MSVTVTDNQNHLRRNAVFSCLYSDSESVYGGEELFDKMTKFNLENIQNFQQNLPHTHTFC